MYLDLDAPTTFSELDCICCQRAQLLDKCTLTTEPSSSFWAKGSVCYPLIAHDYGCVGHPRHALHIMSGTIALVL